VSQFLNIRKRERARVWPLFFVIALLIGLVEASNVAATVQFIDGIGIQLIPVLWIVDVLLISVASLAYGTVADRIPRVRLLSGLLLVSALLLGGLRLLLIVPALGAATYTILYILSDVLSLLYPLTFWALATDMFGVSAGERIFPVLTAGALLGDLLGNAGAGAVGRLIAGMHGRPEDQLIAYAASALLALLLVRLTLRDEHSGTALGRKQTAGTALRESVAQASDFLRGVPLFRLLLITIIAGWWVGMISRYFLLEQAAIRFPDEASFQVFFGGFKAAMTLLALIALPLISGRTIDRLGVKNMFVFLPTGMLVALLLSVIRLDFVSAVIQRVTRHIAHRAFDEPSMRVVYGLIPDERRGRVTVFMESYGSGLGTVGASLFLLVALWIGGGLIPALPPAALYLGSAILMAALSLLAAIRIRAMYAESMLNWRLRRKKREADTGFHVLPQAVIAQARAARQQSASRRAADDSAAPPDE
jgi:hypothetical protein